MNRPGPEQSATSSDVDEAEASSRDAQLARLHAWVAELQLELDFFREQHRSLVASTSWRLTRPLRLLDALVRKSPLARRALSWLRSGNRSSSDDLRAGASAPGEAVRILGQHVEDLATLRDDPTFDADFFLPFAWTRTGAIVAFLKRWVTDERELPSAERLLRRPCPGFHPQIYAHAHAGTYDTALINPLAQFIRSGSPDGPWRHEVITPMSMRRSQQESSIPAAALHAHFHYPELAEDLLRRIAPRGPRCDLLLSTDDAGKAEIVRGAAAGYQRGEVHLRVVPNRGRDIGAFLTGFGDDIVARYELIGHVHGKRSLHAGGGPDPFFGERWREFLCQNLIGDRHPMMDIVLARLVDDGTLGIVFPEDPYLHGWDGNRAIAEGLAGRMGMIDPLPPYFDFPIGTMFWARTAALKPLFALGLGWDDYPREPAANDGTILNAIERLLPFVAGHTGYRFATTHVPGVTR